MDFILDLKKAIFDICDGDRSHKIKLARKIVTLEDVIKAFEDLGGHNVYSKALAQSEKVYQ